MKKTFASLVVLCLTCLGAALYFGPAPMGLPPESLPPIREQNPAPAGPEIPGPSANRIEELLRGFDSKESADAILLAGLRSDLETERAAGVRSLGTAHVKRHILLLTAFLKDDPSPAVRVEAAGGLEYFDSEPIASQALVDALLDTDPGVREHALLSLRAHRNDKVQAALNTLAQGERLAGDTQEAVAAFLNRYYVHLDPFKYSLGSRTRP